MRYFMYDTTPGTGKRSLTVALWTMYVLIVGKFFPTE